MSDYSPLIEETIKHFILNCSSLNAEGKAKLSSKTSSRLLEDRSNPLSVRALMQLALRWDTSKKRSRFLSDAIAKTPHLWAGKIFASHGIIDRNASWQTRRAKTLMQAVRSTDTPLFHPTTTLLRLNGNQLSVTKLDPQKAPVKTEASPVSILTLDEAITYFVRLCNSDIFGISNNLVTIFVESPVSSDLTVFLSNLSRLSYILPLTVSVIVDSPKVLSSIFENPKLDGEGLLWFCADDQFYSCVSFPPDNEFVPGYDEPYGLDLESVFELMHKYQKVFLTANVDSEQAKSDIMNYIELETSP